MGPATIAVLQVILSCLRLCMNVIKSVFIILKA